MFRTDIPGWIHSNEVVAMKRICSAVPTGKSIIEVGVFAGRTTQIFAEACPSSDIYCIDPWPLFTEKEIGGMTDYTGGLFPEDVRDVFMKEVASKYPNVHAVRGFFPDDFPPDVGDVHLIHWDLSGDSTNNQALMRQHFSAAWNILPVGGMLSGRMLASWMPGVVEAVRSFSMERAADIVLPSSASVWYMTKRA